MNKKDSLEWEMRRLRGERRKAKTEVQIVPVERDEYIELLEDEILQLKEEIAFLKSKPSKDSFDYSIKWDDVILRR